METKYKFWMVALIVLMLLSPIVLNFVLLIPAFTPIVGNDVTWLSFWASFIGAIASFVMIFITFHTLKQNQSQLDEIKRQWMEEHRPHLSCRVIVYKKAFFIQVANQSKFDAYNVRIEFGKDFIDNVNDEFRELLVNTSKNPVFISSGKSWNSMIGPCKDVNNEWGNKDFNIMVDVHYNDIYSHHVEIPIKTFVNRVNMVVQTLLEDKIEDLASGLVSPHTLPKHKTIQVSLEEILSQLQNLNNHLSAKQDTSI